MYKGWIKTEINRHPLLINQVTLLGTSGTIENFNDNPTVDIGRTERLAIPQFFSKS